MTFEDAPTAERPLRVKSRMALTRDLRRPTAYVHLLNGEMSQWALNEERAPQFKGQWRQEMFEAAQELPLDLEIGTGNGYHFAHLAQKHPERRLLGIEIKFKPLIQSMRRALRTGATNARILRYDAHRLVDLFIPGELNNVYIHHPDPWLKKRQWKHRLIQVDFLRELHALMRPGSFVEFKTDSRDYFEWAIQEIRMSPFTLDRETWDLHQSPWKDENFVTQFERIFLAQGLPIHYVRLIRS